MRFRHFVIAATCLAALTAPALAETNITILEVSGVPSSEDLWHKIADDYNRQLQQIQELQRQLDDAQTTICGLNTMVNAMRPVFDRYYWQWQLDKYRTS